MGIKQLYPADSIGTFSLIMLLRWSPETRLNLILTFVTLSNRFNLDRRQVLQTLLQTILHTHLSLTDTLLRPPAYYLTPDGQQERTDADDKLDHIRTAVVNMQHLLNELRPVQVCTISTSVITNLGQKLTAHSSSLSLAGSRDFETHDARSARSKKERDGTDSAVSHLIRCDVGEFIESAWLLLSATGRSETQTRFDIPVEIADPR